MPAPSNTAATTAVDITSLPYSVTQTGIHDAGTTYSVWYKHTATATGLLSIFGFGDLVTYQPTTNVFLGPASLPVQYLDFNLSSANRALQLPVTSGVTYYFKFTTNAGNPTPATLTLTSRLMTESTAPVGSILVNDDTEGYPAILIGTNGTILQSIQGIVAGEAGDSLDNGTVALHDIHNDAVAIYDSAWTLITTISSLEATSALGTMRTCLGTQRWWFAQFETGPIRSFRYIDDDGTLGPKHTLTPTATVAAIAASNDETILYHCPTGTNAAIARWDLVSDAALSNLVAGIAGYKTADILVLSDDTILVSYIDDIAAFDLQVLHYSAAGATLHTYSFGATQTFPGGALPRLAYGADDTTFWLWNHPAAGVSQFREIVVSSGSAATTVTTTEFEAGIYQPAVSATPAAYFGNSYSCPFIITRTALTPTPQLNGPAALAYFAATTGADGHTLLRDYPIVRVRRFPHSADEGQRIFYRKLQIDVQSGMGSDAQENPIIELRWSDDGGATFTAWRTMNVGKQGEYLYRCISHALGSARDRVFEVRSSDPYLQVMQAAYVDFDGGVN